MSDLCEMSVRQELNFINDIQLTDQEHRIGDGILKEVRERLGFLQSVGLDYLTLSRGASGLSGGESQRIRLATQIGSALTGVLYVLDEPSIGLHQRDNDKLIATLKRLRDLGNTLVVVEHDEDTMRQADYIVDIGPGAGVHGGEVVAEGSVEDIRRPPAASPARICPAASGLRCPPLRRKGNGKKLRIVGAAENNLKNVNVDIPLGKMISLRDRCVRQRQVQPDQRDLL